MRVCVTRGICVHTCVACVSVYVQVCFHLGLLKKVLEDPKIQNDLTVKNSLDKTNEIRNKNCLNVIYLCVYTRMKISASLGSDLSGGLRVFKDYQNKSDK